MEPTFMISLFVVFGGSDASMILSLMSPLSLSRRGLEVLSWRVNLIDAARRTASDIEAMIEA